MDTDAIPVFENIAVTSMIMDTDAIPVFENIAVTSMTKICIILYFDVLYYYLHNK